MAYYKFTFRKDLITLELECEDSRFIRNQVDKCLEEITGISHSIKPENPKIIVKTDSKKQEKVESKKAAVKVEEKQVVVEPVVSNIIVEELQSIEKVVEEIKEKKAVESEVKAEAETIIEEPAIQPKKMPQSVETEKAEDKVIIEANEVSSIEEVDEIILSLKEDNPIESLVNNIKTASEEVNVLENITEAVKVPAFEETQEIVAEYKFIDKAKKESVEIPEPVAEEPPKDQQNNKFYQILQEKFSSLPEMVNSNLGKKLAKPIIGDNKFFGTLEELIELKKPSNPIEYLVITSLYLKEKELLDRYSLKQINSKVMTFVKKPIDHSIIQEAVAKNLIEVVPDYTGMADVTEYAITPEGENFVNEL